MSKQANANILKQLINSARNNDQVLNGIINQLQGTSVTLDNAAATSIALANVLLNQGQGDDAVAAAMVNGFKAVLYTDWVSATGRQLNDNNLHNNLIAMRNQIVNGLSSQGVVNPAVPGNGTSIFSSAPANNSGSLFSNDNNAAGLFGSAPASTTTPSGANLFGATETKPENVFATAPVAEQPKPAATVKPVVVQAPEKEQNMETYKDHLLVADYTANSSPAKDVNESIKIFRDKQGNFKEVLTNAIENGLENITFGDAAIGVKVIDSKMTYGIFGESMVAPARDFFNNHNLIMSTLNDLEDRTVPEIIKTVFKAIDDCRNISVAYINAARSVSTDSNPLALMDATSLSGLYNTHLYKAVAEGFRIGSEDYTLPGKGKFIVNEAIVDLKDLGTDVYNSTCDGNGVGTCDDYFRQLFLCVAKSIGTIIVELGEDEIYIRSTELRIWTTGNYSNLKKYDVISSASVGVVLSEAVNDLYHCIAEIKPQYSVVLRTPNNDVRLIAPEVGGGIRY